VWIGRFYVSFTQMAGAAVMITGLAASAYFLMPALLGKPNDSSNTVSAPVLLPAPASPNSSIGASASPTPAATSGTVILPSPALRQPQAPASGTQTAGTQSAVPTVSVSPTPNVSLLPPTVTSTPVPAPSDPVILGTGNNIEEMLLGSAGSFWARALALMGLRGLSVWTAGDRVFDEVGQSVVSPLTWDKQKNTLTLSQDGQKVTMWMCVLPYGPSATPCIE